MYPSLSLKSRAGNLQPFDACPRVRIVGSLRELVEAEFSGEVNALCWPRKLPGDFQEIADRLETEPGMTTIDDGDLESLELSPAGRQARETLLADQRMLRRHGLDPILDCIVGYPREGTGPVPTDVYSYHVDTAPVAADTWLCTYLGESSDGLPNEMVVRRIDVPETRAELLKLYGGGDDEGFAAYLRENYFDLHYAPLPGARPYPFGIGNLWRIAIAHPGLPVLPCVHRAPPTRPGAPTRLLLIS